MAAPATLPPWDSNGTHTSAITSGHQTDGYAEDEIPASDEINTLFMLVCAWINWLASNTPVLMKWCMPRFIGAATTGTGAPPDPLTSINFIPDTGGSAMMLGSSSYASGAEAFIRVPIDVPQGGVITAFAASVQAISLTDTSCTMKLNYGNPTTGAVVNVAFKAITVAGITTDTLGSAHAVVAGAGYWIEVNMVSTAGGTGTASLAAVGFASGYQ